MSSQSPVAIRRQARGWTQAVLADRSDVSRTEVSGIETGRLVPSVAVALRLAAALDAPVEELFRLGDTAWPAPAWAWAAPPGETRFWRAEVGGRLRLYPVEPTAAGVIPHDGIATDSTSELHQETPPERTLVMAGCDPLVGLVVQGMAERFGIRVLPLLRSSSDALDLLRQGLVHVAGVHLTDRDGHGVNDQVVASRLGGGHRLVHQLQWHTGIATAPRRRERSLRALLDANVRWVNREKGSAARQTFDVLLDGRPRPDGYARVVRDHRAVAATVSSGWAEAGVCIQPAAAEAGLGFINVQREAYDLCIPESLGDDPRITALESVLRAARYRQFVAHTPGCLSTRTGEQRFVR